MLAAVRGAPLGRRTPGRAAVPFRHMRVVAASRALGAPVVDVVATEREVVVLLRSGEAVALRRPCLLAARRVSDEGEIVRSVHEERGEVLLVSTRAEDGHSSLRCRSDSRGAEPLFASEGPLAGRRAFVDFCGGGAAVTCNGRRFAVWRLRSRRRVAVVDGDEAAAVEEVRACPGLVMLVGRQQGGHLPLRVIDSRTGEDVCRLRALLHRGRDLETVELFDGHVLLQQRDSPLQIVSLRTRAAREVPRHQFPRSVLVFQHSLGRFLALHDRRLTVWSAAAPAAGGRDVEGCDLWTPGDHRCVALAESRRALVAYCKDSGSASGCLRFCDSVTGRALAEVRDAVALSGVCAMHYDARADELLAGHADGTVRVWSNAAVAGKGGAAREAAAGGLLLNNGGK